MEWSQRRQAEALTIAAAASKARFPRCGGFLVWMGHDAFPCPANTAILDFDGKPKPAAHALHRIFRSTEHPTAKSAADGQAPTGAGAAAREHAHPGHE